MAALLITALLQACSMNDGPATHRVHHVHLNGLALELPATLSARQLPEGFLVSLTATREHRNPEQVVVTRHTGANRPDGDWPEQRHVAGRAFSFRETQAQGGSGGEAHVLTAWTPYRGGYVRVEQVVQADPPASPSHTLAWTVMAALGEPGARKDQHAPSP